MLDVSNIRRKRALATARTKRWRAKHAEAWKAYCREYRKRPNAQAKHKAYRAKNRERLNAKTRTRRQANLEATRAKAREQRRRERERELAAMAADPTFEPRRRAYMRDYGKKYRAQNPEKIREWSRRAREKRKAKRAAQKLVSVTAKCYKIAHGRTGIAGGISGENAAANLQTLRE